MPSLQLRGFLVSLLSIIALLVTSSYQSSIAEAQAGPRKHKKTKAPVKPTVALLYFDYRGNDEQLGFLRKGLTQMLVTDLSDNEHMQIVERTDLEAVLKELKLSRSGKISVATRNRIGKLLGARYLITGGYFQYGKLLRIDAKIIDTEYGTSTSVKAEGEPSDFMVLETQLADRLQTRLLKVHNVRLKNQAAARRRKAANRRQNKQPKVTADTIARFGRALDAIDQGNKKVAAKELGALTHDAPHFQPAADELRVLLR